MRKWLKITLGTLDGISAAAVLMWAVLPGLPVYFYAKKHYQYIDKSIKDEKLVHAEPGENFKKISAYGLSLLVPPDFMPTDPEAPNPYLFTTQNSPKSGIAFMAEKDPNPPAEMYEEDRFTPEEVEKGMKGIDLKKPENNYEFYDLTYRLTADKIRLTKHGTWPFFISMAKGKEVLFDAIDSAYSFETEHGKGFIILYQQPEGKSQNYKIVAELYDKENLNRAAHAIISSPSYELAKQIAYSAEIVPLTEADMN